ncbi:hypothetical protein HYV89_00080 [Candidatus Woesearchaeota archaeon]|nr:hypothetical protein [Candidatus Woesearchaeota archaeon]
MGEIIFNKKGISQLIVVMLLVVFVIVVAFLIFKFSSEGFIEESQKGADRTTAQNICRDEVKIRVNDVKDSGDFFAIDVENLKERVLSDFLIRYEDGSNVEIKKARQVLSGYERINVKAEKPNFNPKIVKVIPQIILEDELQTADQGWWLCSGQIAVYNL